MATNEPTPGRWALIIGINDYPMLNNAGLRGCVNDARLMQTILRDKFQFREERIVLLCDAQATRDAILGALDTLATQVQPDDIVVVSYSGHGSQRCDPTAQSSTGMIETLVPHDSGRAPAEDRDIADQEIHQRLGELTQKTRFVTLIFDCCHSATLHRDPFEHRVRSVPSEVQPEGWSTRARVREQGARGTAPAPRGAAGQDAYVVIAACREGEKAYEHVLREGGDPVVHGALTFFLAQQIFAAAGPLTYRDLFERSSVKITAAYPLQRPRCEGARDRLLFGAEVVSPERFVPIARVADGVVTLAAGAAHGVVYGSIWEVPQQPVEEGGVSAGERARLEISEVGVNTAQARVLTSGAQIGRQSHAVEVDRPCGYRWSVEVCATSPAPAAVIELRRLIAESPWLRLAREGEHGVARVYLISPRERVADGDPAPQLKRLAAPTWAVVGLDGELLMRPVAQDATNTVQSNLVKLARFQAILALDNPRSPIADKVEMTVLHRDGQGGWVDAAQGASGQLVVSEGERLAFLFKNLHSARLYLNVLDLGLSKSVALLYPPCGAPGQALAPGRTLLLGEDEEITPYFPADLSLVPQREGERPSEGTQFIKVFVTSAESDFESLLQEGMKPVPRPRDALEQLLQAALIGDWKELRVSPLDQWMAMTRRIILRRPC